MLVNPSRFITKTREDSKKYYQTEQLLLLFETLSLISSLGSSSLIFVAKCQNLNAFDMNLLEKRKDPTNHISPHLVEELLTSLAVHNISFLNHHLDGMIHMALQSPSLLSWRPSFIGHLESFDNDWIALSQFIGFPYVIPFLGKNQHPTSMDPFKAKSSIDIVLKTKPQFLRMLCRLLIVDYLCLPYKLPEACSDMLDSEGLYVPYREKMTGIE
jgi:hypothetical protein